MRILFLNHSPGNPPYSPTTVTNLLNSYASPGTTVDLGYPDNFPGAQLIDRGGDSNFLLHNLRVQPLMAKILWAEQNGYDAVIQSNTYDPGVEAGRLTVRIPVIGLLRTAMHVGLTLADRIGITVATPAPLAAQERHVWRILRAYRIDHFVSGVRGLKNAYADATEGRPSAVFDTAVAAIRELVDDTGAEVVLPLGGAIIPYVVDTADLQAASGVQVLNTKAIGIRFAELCVNLGLTHSEITYPHVPLSAKDLELEV